MFIFGVIFKVMFPQHSAASAGDLKALKRLRRAGCCLSAKDDCGCTPLVFAICNGHEHVVQWLLQFTHVGDVDEDGHSPVWVAAWAGQQSVLLPLVRAGGSVSFPNRNGQTPLRIAASMGHLDVVQWLHANGGVLDDVDHELQSPLFGSVLNGHLDIARWLHKHGADPHRRDRYDQTPLAIAASNHDLAMFTWLVSLAPDHLDHDLQASTGFWRTLVMTNAGTIELNHLSLPAGIAEFARCVSTLDRGQPWSRWKILVALDAVDEAAAAFKSGQMETRADSLHNLIAVCDQPASALWPGSPCVGPEMAQLVRHVMAPWSPNSHFLYPPEFQSRIMLVYLCGMTSRKAPMEMIEHICSFLQ